MTMTVAASNGIEPLNPVLYGLLRRKFGAVRVHNSGSPAQFQMLPDPMQPGALRKEYYVYGEYYAVCCPFCKESGFRLWINHLYGSELRFNAFQRTNTHLAVCYRHDCLRQPGRRKQLEDLIFGHNRFFPAAMPIRQVDVVDVPAAQITKPGEIIPLADLPHDHAAVQYVRSRNFDPAYLSNNFGVGVCVNPTTDKLRIMKNRLYIPIVVNGVLTGWQGRAVDDSAYGPKYYNVPGMQKSRLLYNYDVASKQSCVIIVEGVPSVWRLGAPAVCLFGKTMSHWQRTTIATTWPNLPVFLLLDNDAETEMEIGVNELCRHDVQVIPVFLPDSRDPADYQRSELKTLLADSAAVQNITADLSFLDNG
ncbi:hypothetical protein EBZ39_02210 [bacterium]|nr:hypothetical protein [bacterium]